MKILAIETSCDETAIAVIEARGGFRKPVFRITSNVVASQIAVHRKWGGVVPNLANREHQKNLVPVLKRALQDAALLQNSKIKIQKPKVKRNIQRVGAILEREKDLLKPMRKFLSRYQKPEIDVIAVTNGPGLEPALWVGINFAKALAMAWNKPLVAINHMEGHIISVLLSQNQGSSNTKLPMSKQIPENKFKKSKIVFPAIALLVSGGHTELVLMKNWLRYNILGQTLDDAAGEAFDKVAKMLGLGYPGGPVLARLAEKGKTGIPFPRPMLASKDLNFSFSGLKTAVLYFLQKQRRPFHRGLLADVSASFQQAAVDVLVAKTLRATTMHEPRTIVLGGGVTANNELQAQLQQKLANKFPNVRLLLPEKALASDNAAMVGAAAYFHATKKAFANPRTLKAQGNLRLSFSS